jgi:hypothetical protein
MGLTVQAAPRYPANVLSRRPSQPPAYPKRTAWAVVAGTLCVTCDAWTPLVVTPMQAVSTGPRRAPRSILPPAPSSCRNRASRAG